MATVNHKEEGSTSELRPFEGDRAKHDSSSEASALEDFKRAVSNSSFQLMARREEVKGNFLYAYGEAYIGSLESFKEFCRQMDESEGFEVDYFPDLVTFNTNIPVEIDDYHLNLLNPCAKLAIEIYNNEQKTNFEFVRIVRTTLKAIQYVSYYISFEAKDKNAAELQSIIFQSLVRIDWIDKSNNDRPVIFCRPRPTKKPDYGRGLTVDEHFNRI